MKDFSSPECQGAHRAMRDTLDVIGGKWKLVILSIMLERKWRFKELVREIGISPRILSKELQELEINKLITRTVCNTRPITVEYEATSHSRSLEPVIRALREWGVAHRQEIIGRKENAVPQLSN
ncbi:winged helix-turn-helix transcriptional regulator [Fibrella aquatilis]|uniref:Helix-turn-helix transcriptional regulator n=1 Tax=Fibrella aquatilis TaxID=2817059 RepID=A0A939G667_9BACT|nr:helix-turn-helix domain-containing protein [Fibrella aquatilis]MBO0931760.1 helix-turn-helix transcriptional regulator [Fibrella aquatilis]